MCGLDGVACEDRIEAFDARLDQPCRMVLRRLLRRPGRMIGAAAGIAFGMALFVGMIAILGSFEV